MKLDIRSEQQLKQWLAAPQPAVFLATEKNFSDYIHITDSVDEAIEFIVNHPPSKT